MCVVHPPTSANLLGAAISVSLIMHSDWVAIKALMKNKRKHIVIVAVLILIAVVALFPLVGRKAKASQTDQATAPIAAVVTASRHPISNSLTLSGDFRPFQEVEVHAKVAGYIRRIYVDVGDHVKTGQTLAILEVPELSADLQAADAASHRAKNAIGRAKGDLDRSQSLHAASHLDYTRLKQASAARPGLIAEQELDDALAKDKESEAQIAADQAAISEAESHYDEAIADQKRYQAMSDYTRIVAPFNGVITKRFVDTGALVQAGTNSNTQALPVVNVAETDRFRLTLPVPESAVPSVRLGSTVSVRVPALNRNFDGKVSRFADSLAQDTRTMHTEVDVPNRTGKIVPGMYAEVDLTLEKKDSVLTVPVQAVTRNGDEASILIVDPQDRIQERRIQLGLEEANQVEVISGLSEGDRVVVGSRSEFRPGDVVAPKLTAENNEGKF
jgi:RND family efflux transporter MFP subunit